MILIAARLVSRPVSTSFSLLGKNVTNISVINGKAVINYPARFRTITGIRLNLKGVEIDKDDTTRSITFLEADIGMTDTLIIYGTDGLGQRVRTSIQVIFGN